MTTFDHRPPRFAVTRWTRRAAPLLAGVLIAGLAVRSAVAADKKTTLTPAAESPAKSGSDEKAAAPAAVPAGMMEASETHPSFRVDMVTTMDGKTMTMTRIVDHGRTRTDTKAEGHEMSMIQLDDEAGTMYTLMPSEKKAMKQSRAGMAKMTKGHAPKAEAQTEGGAEPPQGRIELVGKETIDGHPADKYKVSTAEGSGLMWVDSERNLPLRMEAQGAVVEFKNYQFGPQPAELFQPPKGYEVTDMDEMMAKAGSMGGMGGMAGAMAGGMAKGFAGSMAGGMGGSLGGALGGALGGPIGSMVGQYLGQKLGAKIGSAAAGAVLPGK